MSARLQGRPPLGGRVLQDLREQVDGLGRGLGAKDLGPRVWTDLREAELNVVAVHCLDLRTARSAEHLDDLDKLVDAAVSGEERLAQEELSENAAHRPHVYTTRARERVRERGEHKRSRAVVFAYQLLWCNRLRQR